MIVAQIPVPGDALLDELADLLVDCVEEGASVGFLAPLDVAEARDWWAERFAEGTTAQLWVATGESLLGAVVLDPCGKANGRHRAEVQKLLVSTKARGQGVARRLMAALEQHARETGLSLLFLDTETGSTAEQVYQRLGWQRAGEIPAYALSPQGELHPTSLYFKQLA